MPHGVKRLLDVQEGLSEPEKEKGDFPETTGYAVKITSEHYACAAS